MEMIDPVEKTVSVPVPEYQAFVAWRSSVASESFTSLEQVRHRKGLAEINQGNYVSLSKLKNELATLHRQSSQKKFSKSAKR